MSSETKYINPVSAAIGPYLRFKYVAAATITPDKATLTTVLTGSNNDLVFTAVNGGIVGNKIQISYTDPGTAGAALATSITTDDGQGTSTIDFSLATTSTVAAYYETSLTGSDNDILWTAVTAGTDGNDIDIIYVDPSAASQDLTVSVSGTIITVTLATNSGSAITSTASEVLAAVNGDYLAQKLVLGTLADGNDGSGVVTAMSSQDLANGSDGAVITTTAAQIKTALLADSDASALVTADDSGGDDASGVVTAMAVSALTGGTDNLVMDLSLIAT